MQVSQVEYQIWGDWERVDNPEWKFEGDREVVFEVEADLKGQEECRKDHLRRKNYL